MAEVVFATDLELRALEDAVEALGIERYRARQVAAWLYRKNADSYDGMTDLPRSVRPLLAERIPLRATRVAAVHDAADGTRKFLIHLERDGRRVESVRIPEGRRRTLCVSTQAGCPVGCVFCASGLDGLERNLTAGEIIEQVLHARGAADADAAGQPNVVFMGIGEPLLNYEALRSAIRILNARWACGIGLTRMTLSTAGVADKILRLAEEGPAPHLAVSLHAADDELRRRLVPHLRRWSVEEVVAAAGTYRLRTRREVTLEYVLLAGVNDDPAQARALARLARPHRLKVNVIPYNPVPGLPYARPDDATISRFAGTLAGEHVVVTVRRPRGDDISAACGQLRVLDREAPAASPRRGGAGS
jgi:23S rRNA (adenine2503-C2)-methyltransferase